MAAPPDCPSIAAAWLKTFSECIASDSDSAHQVQRTTDCFHPHGYLHDILVFTWTNRTLVGHAKISDFLAAHLADAQLSELRLATEEHLTPYFMPMAGGGRVRVYLRDAGGAWAGALSVFMTLRDIRGHEESGPEEGVYGGHTIPWEDHERERRAKIEKDLYVLIFGGGQTGLNLGARFRQMNIPSIILERTERVGDVWRHRYPSLTLHSICTQHTLLYQSFPTNWPIFTSRDKLANWLESYAAAQDLIVWTSSTLLPTPTFITKSKSLDTHTAGCPKKKEILLRAQQNAWQAEEREAQERADIAAAELAAQEQEAQQRALAEAAELMRQPTPPPALRPTDGRPARLKRQKPRRFRQPEDDLPVPPPPAPVPPSRQPTPDPGEDVPRPRRWVQTTPNRFGVYKVYLWQPTHDPDKTITLANLCATEEFAEAAPKEKEEWYHPFDNPSQATFMQYFHLTPNKDSAAGTNTLLHDILDGPDALNMEELKATADRPRFSVERGNAILDKFTDTPPGQPPNGWRTGSVTINVPSTTIGDGPTGKSVMQYTVGGILYRPLMDIVEDVFRSSAFERMHTTPFLLRWDPKYNAARAVPASLDVEMDEFGLPPLPPSHQELHGEMYTAQRTFEAFSKLPPCEEEPVIASIMPYSDATHLASFGTALLWPLYIYFGNRSKYERAKPSANAGYHTAYFPSVPEDIKDKYKEHYSHAMPDNVMTHTKRELFHAVWELLIDDDFVDAWINGRVFECWDKLQRRLFPRIPMYGLDYPEKVLASTIRFLARYPCPRCYILKTDIPLTGTKHDLLRRQDLREDTAQRRWRVDNAREAIFTKGNAVDGDVVDCKLGEKSWAAIRHAFTKLMEAGADFNLFQIMVVDLLHEIELGIIKYILIHLIRLLYAMDKGKVAEFNLRFRLVPTFGRMTIRRFHRSVSELKKMAARDFEDILQCLLPIAEGLFEEHDALVQRLIFQLGYWHAYAKLRLHTTATLERFQDATEKLCTTKRCQISHHPTQDDAREMIREMIAPFSGS
ncbi:hypothetical protein C8F01DRAFT_1265524 [Mycena amicta]|nr:hypothetical protein C8F01DRAFT_1265524 [Mycena amicta]